MRFKPPPPSSEIGWRVEFRSMEIQLTDHENAAFAVFIVLLTRTILYFNLNFYMPLSKVDENMRVSQKRDAVLTQGFWFRKDVYTLEDMSGLNTPLNQSRPNSPIPKISTYDKMSLNEIFNGSGSSTHRTRGHFKGIISYIQEYVSTITLTDQQRDKINEYISVIKRKASGEFPTGASWIRSFVQSHPLYKKDSVVNSEINYDLIKMIQKLGDSNQYNE